MAGENAQPIDIYRHGDAPLTLHLIRPSGDGPHPVVVDLHGGGWCKGDAGECAVRGELFAANGVASAALDFRQAEAGYPASSQDINYAIRWLKVHGPDHGIDPARVGINGQSSGGHLAALAAMRPDDARYGALPLEGDADATVKCLGLMWPVINPLSRYRRVVALRAAGDPPGWVGDLPERHDTYWVSEEAMEEGNPMLALERGEDVVTPPAIWVQGRPDPVHEYRDPESPRDMDEPDRFVANYRDAGGEIGLVELPQDDRSNPDRLGPLVDFFKTHLA
ncbi:MAG: alpha/beta hydrolase [Alphaproteobacteria bacterium]|nr:alpha/beta hydrolase [Alphaproteobacteria bacterium]